jgi:hypothetical protein
MAATKQAYLPPQICERWLNPFTTCSIISYLVGVIGTTLGEMVTWPSGKQYQDKALKNLVVDGWKAVDPERDDPGFGLSDFNRLAITWGSPLRVEDVVFVRPRADIVEALKNHHIITMAGNVSGVPDPTPLDDHVGGANHRMAFKGYRVHNGTAQTRFFDPMTLEDHKNWGKWVPISDMFAFGNKFKKDGKYLAERFRTGTHTAAMDQWRKTMAERSKVAKLTVELAEAERGQCDVNAIGVALNKIDAAVQEIEAAI